jgi:AraC-like DNA-binding protein
LVVLPHWNLRRKEANNTKNEGEGRKQCFRPLLVFEREFPQIPPPNPSPHPTYWSKNCPSDLSAPYICLPENFLPMLIQVLITIGIAQALALAALLLMKKQKSQADYLLILNMIVLFFTTIFFNYKLELNAVLPGMGMFAMALGYLALPLFFLYVLAASKGTIQKARKYLWLHLLPFAAISLLLFFNFYSLPPEVRLELCCDGDIAVMTELWWHKLTVYGLFAGMFPVYIFLSLRVLRSHEAYILTKFSYTEDVGLSWLNRFLWGVIVMWVAFFLCGVIGGIWLGWFNPLAAFTPGFVAIVATVIYLGLYGWQHRLFSLEEEEKLEAEVSEQMAEKYAASGLTEDQKESYLQALLAFMEEHQPYLEPKVTIGKLAAQTGIPVNYLSQVINEKLDQNFFEFVNSYRVRTFQQLIDNSKNEQFTLLSLAYDSGFNSKSSFNAIFKKLTGQTPSEYVRLQEAGVIQKV